MVRTRLAAPLTIAVLVASAGATRAAPRRAEDEARIEEATRLYLAGQYGEAEKRLAALVVEHPELVILQRKLGVCYYHLRRPEPALTHLRGYLARADRVSAQDREDVERWIAEMEGLREPVVEAPGAVIPPSVSLSATGPPSPSPPSVVASSALPSLQRGFLLLPYVGWQFPVHGPGWIKSSTRFGALIGGRLSRYLSLSGEPAVATWTFLGTHHATQLDFGATLLGHVRWSSAELVVGPRVGWSIVLRNNFDEKTYAFVNGLQLGAKVGLFAAPPSPRMALGVVLDLAYTASYESDSRCFESNGFGELDCNDTNNTAFGALSIALLF